MNDTPEITTTKPCLKCGRLLPTENFYGNRAQPDGLATWCKECQAAYKRRRKERKNTALTRRAELIDRIRPGRPAKGSKDLEDLTLLVHELRFDEGMTEQAIATELGVNRSTVQRHLARAMRVLADGDSREELRYELMLRARQRHETALRKGQLTEARLNDEFVARLGQVVSTGGNTVNVGVNVGSSERVDEALDAWLARNQPDAIEGEVVDAEQGPQAPEALAPVEGAGAAGGARGAAEDGAGRPADGGAGADEA